MGLDTATAPTTGAVGGDVARSGAGAATAARGDGKVGEGESGLLPLLFAVSCSGERAEGEEEGDEDSEELELRRSGPD